MSRMLVQRVKPRINESAMDDSALREGLAQVVVWYVKTPWPVMLLLQ